MTQPPEASALGLEVTASRRQLNRELGERNLLLLAALPLWTNQLTAAVPAEFRPGGDDFDAFVEQVTTNDRGQRSDGVTSAGELSTRVWMPSDMRRQVLQDLRDALPPNAIMAAANGLSDAVLSLESKAAPDEPSVVPPAVATWARLVRDSGPRHLPGVVAPSLELVNETRVAVDDDDLARAQQLQGLAESLAPVLQGEMELSATRTARLVDLGYRRRTDARRLGSYLRRPELDRLVLDLLRGDEHWALHIRGAGGVGKTMLVRDVASRDFSIAHPELPEMSIARADFDHLDAKFPVREPIELLLVLADELALYTASNATADTHLMRFRLDAVSVHERFNDTRSEARADLDDPLVNQAIQQFRDTLAAMSGTVLLILDTCEELAKAYPGDPSAPGVVTMLSILERLKYRNPNLRVLLCGRRELPARDYLREERLPGFSRIEAEQYVTSFAPRPLAPELIDAMIRQSPALDEPGRCNPFDLALHLDWVARDPNVDASALLSGGSDTYVKVRVIGRLGDAELLAVMPVVSALGEVTRASLSAALRSGADVEGVFARLGEQEWTDADAIPAKTLTVKSGLLRRLRSYYADAGRRADAATAVARAAERLVAALSTQSEDADTATVVGALRICDPEQAANLWDALVGRVERTRRWGGLFEVARRVEGAAEEEDWPSRPAIKAAITATYIAELQRAEPLTDPSSLWAEVAAWAQYVPSPDRRAELVARATFGRIGFEAGDKGLPNGVAAIEPTPRLTASVVAAVERLQDLGRLVNARELISTPCFGAALEGRGGGEVQLWARELRASLDPDSQLASGEDWLGDERALAAGASEPRGPAW